MVANVRSVFSGDLTYCSLFYKEWQNINWWDGTCAPCKWAGSPGWAGCDASCVLYLPALDWMGIDAYFFLAYPGTVTPSVATMAVQLAKNFDKVRSFRANHSLTHIPLVFTEVGYGSYTTYVLPAAPTFLAHHGARIHSELPCDVSVAGSPGTSPPTESCGANFTSDFGAQQRCYETLFQVSAANADMLDKLILFWWVPTRLASCAWPRCVIMELTEVSSLSRFDNPSTPDFYVNATHHRPVWDCWFTPRGKPAYKSMQAAFAAP